MKEGDYYEDNDDGERLIGCFFYFCVYVGWVFCFVMLLVFVVFVVFYSFMWGKEVVN